MGYNVGNYVIKLKDVVKKLTMDVGVNNRGKYNVHDMATIIAEWKDVSDSDKNKVTIHLTP